MSNVHAFGVVYLDILILFRDFRLKLIAAKTPKGKGGKGKEAVPTSPPTHCTAYVAKSYPAWQATVLDTLRY